MSTPQQQSVVVTTQHVDPFTRTLFFVLIGLFIAPIVFIFTWVVLGALGMGVSGGALGALGVTILTFVGLRAFVRAWARSIRASSSR